MSYINWNGETNEQKLARKKREELELFEQAAQIRSARSAQSANGAAGAGGALTLPDFKTINGESILGIGDIEIPVVISSLGTSIYSVTPLAGPIAGSGNIALGEQAGINSNTIDSIFIGKDTGGGSTSIYTVNIGYGSGSGNSGPNDNSVFIGRSSGSLAIGQASNSVFIGNGAGLRSSSSWNSNFIGRAAGEDSRNTNRCNFFGDMAGYNSNGNNVNAFGFEAHKNANLSGQTVFSNVTLPSYLNRAAATAALTVSNGAAAGCTYLYYNQTTFAIEGVRL